MTTLADELERTQSAGYDVHVVRSSASSSTILWVFSQGTSSVTYSENWIRTTSNRVESDNTADAERAAARERMRRMREYARSTITSSPDYPDSEQDREEQNAVTQALHDWQNEAIWNS
jgi:hypothetical protein